MEEKLMVREPKKKKQPVLEFESQEQLDKYLRWWKKKLMLRDWIITAKLCTDVVDPATGDELNGQNHLVYENGSAVIMIRAKSRGYSQEGVVNTERFVAEEALVHELLHLKYGWLNNQSTYEAKYVEASEHKTLAQMARSLIMIKYDIGLSFFLPDYI